jgi:hypothetical protein
MVVQPTALNVLIIGLSMIVFTFLVRMLANYMADRNPDSGFAKALSIVL